MKRKALFLVTLISLITSSNAFASVKPGALCPKLGVTTVVSGKKFTCTKSGKKLLWNQGVAIKNQLNTNKNTGDDSQVSTLKGNFEMPTKVYNEITSEYLSRKLSGIEAELLVSPNFNQKLIELNMFGVYKAMDFWSDVFKPNYKFPIFFVNPIDKTWFNETFPKRVDNPEYLKHFNNNYADKRTNFGAGDSDSDRSNSQSFIVFVNTNDYRPNFGSTQIGAHEYTHAVQHTFKIWNGNEQFPCWVKEGQAMLFGMVLAQPTLKNYLEVRFKFYQNTPEARTDLPQNSPNWINFFKNAEVNKMNCASGGVYEAGALAFEYLYSKYGKNGMIEFWKNLETESNFEGAILKTFNVKKLDLYKDFGLYIEGQLVELRKN